MIDFFGTVSKKILRPGINLVNPFADVVKMSIKTKEVKETISVPTQEGLSISLGVSLLYHLNPDSADEVYKTVGPIYEDVLIYPQFRSVIRTVTSAYEAKALYTSVREKLAEGISDELTKQISPRGIVIENTPANAVYTGKGAA